MNEVQKTPLACTTCGARVQELRRGRCWPCYARWSDQRPVGVGARCAVCDDRRRDNLRLVEVQGRSLALCHLCAARVGKLEVVPYSVEGLRASLRRDRRQVERREGDSEARDEDDERRVSQRRAFRPGVSEVEVVGISSADAAWARGQSGDNIDLDLDLALDRIAGTAFVARAEAAAAAFDQEDDDGEETSVVAVEEDDIVEATRIAEAPRAPETTEHN